jgi:Ca-activated chloride channel homolog
MALEGPQGVRLVAAAFAVADSNFPLRVGFPLFVSNVVHWLAGRRSETEAKLKAGQTFIPLGGERISPNPVSQGNEAKDQPPPLIEGPLKLAKNGFYDVRGPFRSRWLAINTGDAAESDLRTAESTTDNIPMLSRSWGALQSWRWLALAATVLIVTEWFLHHRRVTE